MKIVQENYGSNSLMNIYVVHLYALKSNTLVFITL